MADKTSFMSYDGHYLSLALCG